MAISTKCLAGTILALTISAFAYSQKSPSTFGKISEELLSSEICPIDSNAHAYFVFDYGFSYFQYATTKIREGESTQNQKGFQLIFNRHLRIKILDNEGFDWSNFEIPLYRDVQEEEIGKIKATTYNLENGKILKTKLDRKDIYTEETNDFWIQKKFAMPNVKKGSVIEVEYTIVSDFFFNLREWTFQTTIPVMRSEYYVHIPEYYIYNQTQKGYYPIKYDTGQKKKQISITYSYDSDNSFKPRESSTSTTDYYDNTFYFIAEEIPAFPSEEFLRTKDNYLTKVEFELQRTNFPGRTPTYYTTSWEQVDDRLINSTDFGKALSRNGHLDNVADALKAAGQEGLSLANAAFLHIKSTLAWDGNQNKYASNSLTKTYQEGGGNSADINLNLVALLNNLGLESYPVVLSTQKHGIIHPSHPSLSSFNYVIAMVKIDDENYLMDATDPYGEINLLPVRCLNDKGRVIGAPGEEWINLMDYKPYQLVSNYALTMDESLVLSGSRKLVVKDYASYHYKTQIKEINDPEKYESTFGKEHEDFHIENLQVEGLDSMVADLTLKYEITDSDFVENGNDILYFSPVIDPFFKSNPLKLERREYPVEFNYPYLIKESIFITLPEGYRVSEFPNALNIRMPDNSAQYTYQVVVSGSNLIINTNFILRKSQFLPEEYEGIKQFFQIIIDKQNELVVLAKS
jgi:hypothetical protein